MKFFFEVEKREYELFSIFEKGGQGLFSVFEKEGDKDFLMIEKGKVGVQGRKDFFWHQAISKTQRGYLENFAHSL